MKKKKSVIVLVAVFTTIVGAVLAVGAYLKRKARDLGDTLDYDGSIYFEDDEDAEDFGDMPEDDTTESAGENTFAADEAFAEEEKASKEVEDTGETA